MRFLLFAMVVMGTNNPSEAMARFRKKMESFAPVSDADFVQLANTLHEKNFDKGEVLLKSGQVCRQVYFIISGCMRSFGLENGREINVKFYFEDDLVSDFSSYRLKSLHNFILLQWKILQFIIPLKQRLSR